MSNIESEENEMIWYNHRIIYFTIAILSMLGLTQKIDDSWPTEELMYAAFAVAMIYAWAAGLYMFRYPPPLATYEVGRLTLSFLSFFVFLVMFHFSSKYRDKDVTIFTISLIAGGIAIIQLSSVPIADLDVRQALHVIGLGGYVGLIGMGCNPLVIPNPLVGLFLVGISQYVISIILFPEGIYVAFKTSFDSFDFDFYN